MVASFRASLVDCGCLSLIGGRGAAQQPRCGTVRRGQQRRALAVSEPLPARVRPKPVRYLHVPLAVTSDSTAAHGDAARHGNDGRRGRLLVLAGRRRPVVHAVAF